MMQFLLQPSIVVHFINTCLIKKYPDYMESSYIIFINTYITKHYPYTHIEKKKIILSRLKNIIKTITKDREIVNQNIETSITDTLKYFLRRSLFNLQISDPEYNNYLEILRLFINGLYKINIDAIETIQNIIYSDSNINELVLYMLKYSIYILSDYSRYIFNTDIVKYSDEIYDLIIVLFKYPNIFILEDIRLDQLEKILQSIHGNNKTYLDKLSSISPDMGVFNTDRFNDRFIEIITFKTNNYSNNSNITMDSNDTPRSNTSILSSILLSDDDYNNTPLELVDFPTISYSSSDRE